MVKKVDMIKTLKEGGIDIPDGTTWNDLKKIYNDYKKTLTSPPMHSRSSIEIVREELYPEIKKFMENIKLNNDISLDDIYLLTSLYNRYYLRSENPKCGICVAMMYESFKKIVKNNK